MFIDYNAIIVGEAFMWINEALRKNNHKINKIMNLHGLQFFSATGVSRFARGWRLALASPSPWKARDPQGSPGVLSHIPRGRPWGHGMMVGPTFTIVGRGYFSLVGALLAIFVVYFPRNILGIISSSQLTNQQPDSYILLSPNCNPKYCTCRHSLLAGRYGLRPLVINWS